MRTLGSKTIDSATAGRVPSLSLRGAGVILLGCSLWVFLVRAALTGLVGPLAQGVLVALPATIICASLTVLGDRGRVPSSFPWIVGFFAAFVPGGLVLASLVGYSLSKVAEFFVVTFLLVLAAAVLVKSEREVRLLNGTILVIGVAVLLLSFVLDGGVQLSARGRQTSFDLNPLNPARLASFVASLAILQATLSRGRTRYFSIFAAGLGLYFTLASGSRGPLLGITLGVVGLILFSIGARRSLIAKDFAWLALGAVSVGLAVRLAPDRGVDRIVSTASGQGVGSRSQLYARAWESIMSTPFGLGMGDFSGAEISLREYAHNIFLEAGAEAGLPALLATVVLVGGALRMCWKARGSWGALVVVPVAVALGNAMVSADLNGNRVLIIYAFIAVSLGSRSGRGPHATESHGIRTPARVPSENSRR